MTPTKEQIKAEMTLARKIAKHWASDPMTIEVMTSRIATALATARLEERNKTLDEAAARINDRFAGQVPKWIADDILALKHKDNADE